MSANVVDRAVSIGLAWTASANLVICQDPVFGVFELVHGSAEEGTLQVAIEAHALVERILQSTCVVLESADGQAEILSDRDLDSDDSDWLSQVASSLIESATSMSFARQVVELALCRILGTTVTLARRPKVDSRTAGGRAEWFTGVEAGGLMSAASRRGIAGRATAGRELCFLESRDDWWTVVVPWRAARVDAQAVSHQPLLQTFAARLRTEEESRRGTVTGDSLRRLIRASSSGDTVGFVTEVSSLVGGRSALLDRDGVVVAAAGERRGTRSTGDPHAHRGRDILLRTGDGLCGSLSVPENSTIPPDLIDLLECLGSSLAQTVASKNDRRATESQLLIMQCLASEAEAFTYEQPVWSTPEPVSDHESGRLLSRILQAGADHPELAGLHLVGSAGGLLGLYLEEGQDLDAHVEAWRDVLRCAAPGGSTSIAISAPVGTAAAAREQLRAVLQLAKVQESRSRFFALPAIILMDNVGPLAELLVRVPGQQLTPFIERVLGDLLDDQRFGGQLLETLYAYLQTGGSPSEAGGLLHLHASTVKYRMRVIRDLLGDRLDDQSERFDLELAVRLCLASRHLSRETRR
mgnify:FL=1